MVGWHHQLNGHEFEQALGNGEGQGSLALQSMGGKESDMTEQQNKNYIQFRSVAQSCPTLCNPMNGSTLSLPVDHQLPEFTQTHVH